MKPLLRSLLILLVASAVLGGAWWWLRHTPRHWWRDDIVAEFEDRFITSADLADGLRTYLWRRKQHWESMAEEARAAARQEVLRDLLRQTLLRHHRRQQEPAPAVQDLTAREFEIWQKQFQQDGERTLRLGWQGLDESQVEKRIAEAAADRAWLESQVQARLRQPTEQDLREWFTTHAESLRIPAAHRASHIYLTRHDKEKPDREAEIRAIHAKLTAGGATFAELAAQFSEDDRSKNRGGDLGWFTRDRMPKDFITAVEALTPGQTSPPMPTKLGWHIIHLRERRPSRMPNFEDVRVELEAMLISQARDEAVTQIVAETVKLHEQKVWQTDPATLARIAPAKIGND